MTSDLDPLPLVSVVMGVYDGDRGPWLKSAVDSILNQTYANLEFVIVTDGVTDAGILAVLECYRARDGRVVLKHEPKHNLAFVLNSGVASSRGALIARMDADDISVPDRLALQVGFLLEHPEIDICGSFIDEFESGTTPDGSRVVSYPCDHDGMRRQFLRRNPIAHVSVMFRRSFFAAAGQYPHYSDTNQDTLLWLSGFLCGCRFANLPQPLVSVRFDRATSQRRNGAKKSFRDLFDRLTVINELQGGPTAYLQAAAMFLVQNMPGGIYGTIRHLLIHRRSR